MLKKKKKILVVEDDKPMARALKLKLSHVGFDVRNAFNGEEAIAALGAAAFDLAILDLMMPKKDGFFVLQTMKEKEISLPVIVLSNLSQEEDIKKAKELGARDFFVKSDMSIADVVGYVESILS